MSNAWEIGAGRTASGPGIRGATGLVPLRVRSHYSPGAGPASPTAMVDRARELRLPGLALTEVGSLLSFDEFLGASAAAGIAARIGAEVPVRLDPDGEALPLLLLCESAGGYRNLARLLSLPQPPDRLTLAGHSTGLIAASGFVGSEPARAIARGQLSVAKRALGELAEVFGPRHLFLAVEAPAEGERVDPAPLLHPIAASLGLRALATGGFALSRPEEGEIARVLGELRGERERAPRRALKADWHREVAAVPGAVEANREVATRLWDPRSMLETAFAAGSMTLGNGGEVAGLLSGLRMEMDLRYRRADASVRSAARRRFRLECAAWERAGTLGLLPILQSVFRDDPRALREGIGRVFGSSSLLAHLAGLSPIDPVRERLRADDERAPILQIQIDPREVAKVGERLAERFPDTGVAHPAVVERYTIRGLIAALGPRAGLDGPALARLQRSLPAHARPLGRLLRERADVRHLFASLSDRGRFLCWLLELEGVPRGARPDSRVLLLARDGFAGVAPLRLSAGGPPWLELTRVAARDRGWTAIHLRSNRHLETLTRGLTELGSVVAARAAAGRRARGGFRWDDRGAWGAIGRAETIGVPYLEGATVQAALRKERPRSIEELASLLARTLAGASPGPVAAAGERDLVYREDACELIEECTDLSPARTSETLEWVRCGAAVALGRARLAFMRGAANRGVPAEKAADAFARLTRHARGLRRKSLYLALAREAYLGVLVKRTDPVGYLVCELRLAGNRRDREGRLIEEARRIGVPVHPVCANASEWESSREAGGLRLGLHLVAGITRAFGEALVRERARNGPYSSFTHALERLAAVPRAGEELALLEKAGVEIGSKNDNRKAEVSRRGARRRPVRRRRATRARAQQIALM